MTVTEDAPPIVDTGFDTVPTKPKRTRSAKPRSQPAPENDRRRGPRPKKDIAAKFTAEVQREEGALDTLEQRWSRADTLATEARERADALYAELEDYRNHVEHLKQSKLYQGGTQ